MGRTSFHTQRLALMQQSIPKLGRGCTDHAPSLQLEMIIVTYTDHKFRVAVEYESEETAS
jgi:hypothetical protein